MAPLLEFQAGKAYRRGETNWVDPNPNRGLIYLQLEDDLMHFYYKDLVTNAVEDLVMFPGDASFLPASGTSRVHVLKFHSSSDRHFFWAQAPDAAQDEANAAKVNELIGHEEAQAMDVEAPAASTSALETPAPATRDGDASSAPGAPKKAIGSAAQMAQLRDILANLGSASAGGAASGSGFANDAPEYLLPDVLPASVLTPLLTPSLVAALTPFLPTEVTQDASSLARAIESPEFKRAVASLDRALRTGALGPLVAGLGLGEESAMGVQAFLEGIQKQADEAGEGMQED